MTGRSSLAAGDLNTIAVLERELLLVDVGGGSETHLARRAEHGGRAAVEHDDDVIPPAVTDDLDGVKWEDTTLCGRRWHGMAPGPDDLTSLWQEAAFAPTCRGCLRIVDSWLPITDAPPGLQLLASVVAERVIESSSTFVSGIPGQHLEVARRAIRSALRSRGYRSNTHVADDVLAVWSDDAYNALDRDELRASAATVIERIVAGEVSEAPTPKLTIAWSTWIADR